MEQLAARVEGFLAEHSGSQRVVRDQKARRKAVLDKQHAARAADAMNRRGIVGSLLSAAVSAPASDSSGDAFEERSKSVLDSPTVAVECDDFMRDAGSEIPTASDLDDVDVATAHGSSKASSRSIRLKLMAEFATPEWMLEVPPDLNGAGKSEIGWFVFPRPEGKSVFVIAAKGQTSLRDKNGLITSGRFPSLLPGGSRQTNRSSDDVTVLEGVLYEDSVVYVTDILCWKGYEVHDCTAEFRQYWLRQKLDETDGLNEQIPNRNRFAFRAPPLYECDTTGIQTAYEPGSQPYKMDGLIFACKAGLYESGVTPLSLVWKDRHSSSYPVETKMAGEIELQLITLEFCSEPATLTTADKIVVTTVPPDTVSALSLRPGDLLQFTVTSAAVNAETGAPEFAGMSFVAKASERRLHADTISKIVFQSLLLSAGAVTISDILAVA